MYVLSTGCQWRAIPKDLPWRSTLHDYFDQVEGKKRHIFVDTQGLLMPAIVHAADIQDRDGGALLMATLLLLFRS